MALAVFAFLALPCGAQEVDRSAFDWAPGAHWRYVSVDGRFDLDVFIVHQAEHADKGIVHVVAVKPRNEQSNSYLHLSCLTITRHALEQTLTERVGVADITKFGYCIDEPWPTEWSKDNVIVVETSIADAQDLAAEVCRRTRTGPCKDE